MRFRVLGPLQVRRSDGDEVSLPDPTERALVTRLIIAGGAAVSSAELLAAANDLFAMVASGKIKIEISRSYPLQDAPRAHADMESRRTTGSIVLVV